MINTNNKLQPTQTKKGAASLYVVIFTTLLLGIITLGFIRIMLSETIQTSNADLSQSAYDSALAGIEDAKVALLKYHECLSNNSATPACENARKAMQADTSTSNCDIVRTILYDREAGEEHETIIQSNTTGSGAEMQQAYTCVLISEDNKDYLGQLNENYHSKVIPLRTADVNAIKYVRVDWYSSANATTNLPNLEQPSANLKSTNKPESHDDASNTGLFPSITGSEPYYAPPTLGVQLLQTDTTFTLSELDHNNGNNTDRGTLLLYPSINAPSNVIESNSGTGFSASADKAINIPTAVKCQDADDGDSPYLCSTTLAIPAPYKGGARSDSSTFLRLFLPYGTPETDFSVTLCKASTCDPQKGETMLFLGVQARIDSTGRANDLFRRIESRVELVDVYFPFPEYSASLRGPGSDTLNKNFWVTKNNWGGKDSGEVSNQ